VTFWELVANPSVRPKEDFILVSWEPRSPPLTLIIHLLILLQVMLKTHMVKVIVPCLGGSDDEHQYNILFQNV
jgi:hypothetical protein